MKKQMIETHQIDRIQARLTPLREKLLTHPVYPAIDSLERLQVFMQHHVFAVWDFMSLLKALQARICGSNLPWLPPQNRIAARLVNEIVLGEETDVDRDGNFASHFDLYHQAMNNCGADTKTINVFLNELREGQSLQSALATSQVPESVQHFVRHTFEVIEQGNLCAIASAFTFGREDLLPDVFQRVVDELNVAEGGGLDDFRYYLDRHIELDGDHHGPMAARMINEICGDDDSNWQIAEDAAVGSLKSRLALWDGMHETMQSIEKTAIGRQ